MNKTNKQTLKDGQWLSLAERHATRDWNGRGYLNAVKALCQDFLSILPAASEAEKRIAELEAARMAYASEFPPNADGEPDVGNIHANIRALKAKVAASEAGAVPDKDDLRRAVLAYADARVMAVQGRASRKDVDDAYATFIAALDAPQPTTVAQDACGRCNGSGESMAMVGGGPDAHDELHPCPECGGTGNAAPAAQGDPAEPKDDSDRSYDRPIGYLPAYELERLHSGHDARLRSAKFGPSALDGDVPVYLDAPTVPHSLAAAQGDERAALLRLAERIEESDGRWPLSISCDAAVAIRAALDRQQGGKLPANWIDQLNFEYERGLEDGRQQGGGDAEDAARYRELRAGNDYAKRGPMVVLCEEEHINVDHRPFFTLAGTALDADIDAARAQRAAAQGKPE